MNKKILKVSCLVVLLLCATAVSASHDERKKTIILNEGYAIEANWMNADGSQKTLNYDESIGVTDFIIHYCLSWDHASCKDGFLKIQDGIPEVDDILKINDGLSRATLKLDTMPANENTISLNNIRFQVQSNGPITKKCGSYTEVNGSKKYRIDGCTWSRPGIATGSIDGIDLGKSYMASLIQFRKTSTEITEKKNNKRSR